MPALSNRLLYMLIFLACLFLLGTAILIEPFRSMNPCPMCMMQRAVFVALAAVTLVAALHNPSGTGRFIYGGATLLIAVTGAAIAGRQIWLQSLPEDQVPACGPGLEYMLDVFPLLEVIQMSLVGTGDCAEVQWTLFGISIPGWSFLAFSLIAVIALYTMIRKRASDF